MFAIDCVGTWKVPPFGLSTQGEALRYITRCRSDSSACEEIATLRFAEFTLSAANVFATTLALGFFPFEPRFFGVGLLVRKNAPSGAH